MGFVLADQESVATIIIEEHAYEGVRRIAQKVCNDIALVTGKHPVSEVRLPNPEKPVIVVGTLLKSEILGDLENTGVVDLSVICGKRECFSFQVVNEKLLVIAGSDKRGTIYGLFHISELLGVSPWVRFADVIPAKKACVTFGKKDSIVSKEPSVKYRGFFINDEWPAFGNWTFEHFGGFNAEMYDMIFETLLRLKGNYLWPAMWTSSFTLDGPGEKNAVLADCYGIVMSNSHHEPCLRHSEEWDLVRGKESVYGNEWNYVTNREGLLRYWRDGLTRSGKYENIITIGMRGERDSLMLGADAGLAENIELLKEIIGEQRKLIAECVGDGAPQMIALYKEVEAYYYGDENTPGLKDWDGLDGVTLMLCEDNYGNMRTLPTEENRDHDAGFGMYYHFDYHGSPISYEWVNSSYLPKIWDQMTMAYEFGVRDIWVVNVGDLKFQEYPLSFFMDLAYDFEKWGSSRFDAPQQYLKKWVEREFGMWLSDAQKEMVCEVMDAYTRLNHNRKPEAMSFDTYHPIHFDESRERLHKNEQIRNRLELLRDEIPEEILPEFWELVYYPAMGSVNVSDMQLFAGQNACFSRMGAMIANEYADRVKACIRRDRELTDDFHHIADGKWSGMGNSEHIGFVNWNEEECKYPRMTYIEPANKPRLIAYAKGADCYTSGGDWTKKTIHMRQFMQAGADTGTLLLQNAGKGVVSYEILCDMPGIFFDRMRGSVTLEEEILVRVQKNLLRKDSGFIIRYEGGNIPVVIDADYENLPDCPPMTFLEYDGMIAIEAEHFAKKKSTENGAFQLIPDYGKTSSGIKAVPVTKEFIGLEAPYVEYNLWIKEKAGFWLAVYTAPSNPVRQYGNVSFSIAVNGAEAEQIALIPEGYRSGEPSCADWAQMVLEQIRISRRNIVLEAGLNTLRIYAGTPAFLLEKIVLIKEGKEVGDSYMGMPETYHTV